MLTQDSKNTKNTHSISLPQQSIVSSHAMTFLSRSNDKKKLLSTTKASESLTSLDQTAAPRSSEATLTARDTAAATQPKAKMTPEEAFLKLSQDLTPNMINGPFLL